MQTLHVCATRKGLRNLLPILASILLDCIAKLKVFFLGPVTFKDALARSFLIFRRTPLVEVWMKLLLIQDDSLG